MSKELAETESSRHGVRNLGKRAIKAYAHNSIRATKAVARLVGLGGFVERL